MRRYFRKLFRRLWWLGFESFLRAYQVGEVEGIRLADFRKRGDSFLATLTEAIRLIQTHDPRRFARVRKHIAWISNEVSVSGGAAEQYVAERWCIVDYFDPAPDTNRQWWSAVWACTLVHEATHGTIEERGFKYEGDRRPQIERICRAEQNRFARRLQKFDPIIYADMVDDFDSSAWQSYWDRKPLEHVRSFWRRLRKD